MLAGSGLLLSIKTLRADHDAGILVPAQVDRFTADQLADAAIVRRLRALDLPLDKVRQILHGRDPDLTRRVRAGQQVLMQARLADTERIVAELQSGIAPAQPHRGEFSAWLGSAFERLGNCLDAAGIAARRLPGTLYDAEIADDLEYVAAFIPVAAPFVLPGSVRDVSLGEGVRGARRGPGPRRRATARVVRRRPVRRRRPGPVSPEIAWPIKGATPTP